MYMKIYIRHLFDDVIIVPFVYTSDYSKYIENEKSFYNQMKRIFLQTCPDCKMKLEKETLEIQ